MPSPRNDSGTAMLGGFLPNISTHAAAAPDGVRGSSVRPPSTPSPRGSPPEPAQAPPSRSGSGNGRPQSEFASRIQEPLPIPSPRAFNPNQELPDPELEGGLKGGLRGPRHADSAWRSEHPMPYLNMTNPNFEISGASAVSVSQGMHVEGEVMLASGESGATTSQGGVRPSSQRANSLSASDRDDWGAQVQAGRHKPRRWLPAQGTAAESLTLHLGLSGVKCASALLTPPCHACSLSCCLARGSTGVRTHGCAAGSCSRRSHG